MEVVDLSELLEAPLLDGVEVVAGVHAVGATTVSWASVLHFPATEFAKPGDLVLTTGLGCDAKSLERFVVEVAERGAAAIGFCFPPGGALFELSSDAAAAGDRHGIPVLMLPWELHFADVQRLIIGELEARRDAADVHSTQGLLTRFSSALLAGEGINGVARALEQAIGRPSLVFDSRFALEGLGPLATRLLGTDEVPALRARSNRLSSEEVEVLVDLLDFGGPRRTRLEALGLGAGLGIAVAAGHRVLGYVLVLDDGGTKDGPAVPGFDVRALEQASIAVAMEMMRRRAGADSESAARQDLFWSILAGTAGPETDVARRAALLGFDVRGPYGLALAQLPEGPDGLEVGDPLRDRARAAGAWVSVDVNSGRLALLAGLELDGGMKPLVEELRDVSPLLRTIPWGLAQQSRKVTDLRASFVEADRALAVGRAVLGPADIADPTELGAHMVLSVLWEDPVAMAAARDVLRPLLDYDAARDRNLLETLEVYLEEACNTSATARRLYFNRHSLLYRLRKIEEMSGRSLTSPADRFVLDLSLRLLRAGPVATTTANVRG